jgi:hypothetical protein
MFTKSVKLVEPLTIRGQKALSSPPTLNADPTVSDKPIVVLCAIDTGEPAKLFPRTDTADPRFVNPCIDAFPKNEAPAWKTEREAPNRTLERTEREEPQLRVSYAETVRNVASPFETEIPPPDMTRLTLRESETVYGLLQERGPV